jgi:hypothetical protein
MRAQKRNLLVMKFKNQKLYGELKKVFLMGSEIQLGVMRAQKHEIQKSRVIYLLIKNFIFSLRKLMELEVFVTIMNRKSSYGCAKHFSLYFSQNKGKGKVGSFST